MKTRHLFTASVLFSIANATGAAAQEIEIVTVTAAKRAQDVQDVPIAMNVFQQEQIEQFNVATFTDLQGSIPSFYIQHTPGNNGLYLRGFGSSPSNPGFEQTVSLYMDGVYYGRSRQYMAPFFDVERIEVLRGPQGALLGKNTAAGAISIITRDPTEEFEAAVTGSYNIDRQGFETFGSVSMPLTDEIGARLAFRFQNLDGYIRNTVTNKNDPREDNKSGRLTLKFDPEKGISVKTKFTYNSMHQKGQWQVKIPINVPLQDSLDSNPFRATSGPFGRETFVKQNDYASATQADFDLGGYTLTAITGFSAFTTDAWATGGVVEPELSSAVFQERFSQGSQEIRLLSPDGQTVEWIVGGYADYSNYAMLNISGYQFIPAFGNGQTTARFRQSGFSYSVFASATWHITDDLRLLGNARFSHVGKRASFVSTVDFGTPLLGATARTVTGSISENHFDPSFTLQYDIDDDIMVYAVYAKGSKGGAFDVLNRGVLQAGFATKAETSTNYEVGAKVRLWGWLQADGAIYRMDFKNLQVAAFDPALFANVTKNAGTATSQGVELSITADTGHGLVLGLSGAYLDAWYTDFPGAGCTRLQTNPPTVPPCAAATNNLRGYPLQFASKWTGQAKFDYTRLLDDSLEFKLTATADLRSKAVIASDYDPVYGVQPGFVKFNARIEVGDPDEAWSVAVIGKNLNDARNATQTNQWPFEGPVTVSAQLEEGRTVSLQGSLKF